MARARGYHYVRLPNGRKKRVYNRGGGRRTKGITRKRRGGRRVAANSYTGYGAYKRQSNTRGRQRGTGRGLMYAMGHGNIEANVPKIRNSKGGVVRIQHTEYLFDVLGTNGFISNAFILNPGLNLSDGGFSVWLYNVAQNFEEWKARGICFHFKSTSAEYSTATGSALGTVSMATNYNSLNPNFTSKQVMENYEGATSTKPSKNQNHFVECSNKQTPVHPMYVRTGPVPAGGDQRLYDLGVFQLATNGMNSTNAAVVGELWVSYEIDFFKPRINPQPDGIWDHFQIAAGAGILPATPFGTVGAKLFYATSESTAGGAIVGGATTAGQCQTSTGAAKDSFLGGFVVNGAGGQAGTTNTYYFPLDAPIGSVWYLSYSGQNFAGGVPGASTWTPIQSTTGTNSCSLNIAGFHLGVTGQSDNAGAGNATSFMANALVTIATSNASITFTNAGGQLNNGGGQYADFYAFQLGSPVN